MVVIVVVVQIAISYTTCWQYTVLIFRSLRKFDERHGMKFSISFSYEHYLEKYISGTRCHATISILNNSGGFPFFSPRWTNEFFQRVINSTGLTDRSARPTSRGRSTNRSAESLELFQIDCPPKTSGTIFFHIFSMPLSRIGISSLQEVGNIKR